MESTIPPTEPAPSQITIAPNPARVIVRAEDRIIADTRRALTMREAGCAPVHYIPRADVDMSLLTRSDHHTYCPYKGTCSYFSIPLAGGPGVNAVWSYEAPYPAVDAIKEYLAFYPDRVDAVEELP